MSGVSLATGHRSDLAHTTTTTAPDMKSDQKSWPDQQRHQSAAAQAAGGGVMGSLRIIELQLVAFIMVFSASGLVPLLDILYPAFTTAYLIGLAQFAFPSHHKRLGADSNAASQEIFHGSRMFRFYVILGTTVGLFLPLAYVLGGFARGDEHAVRSATPHLFLLSCQILTENVISGLSLFSPPVRALVPLLYTVRRIFVIIDWINDVWINKALPANADIRVTTLKRR
ncbi:OLC1v1028631C2 [Oldenlandia corymbosa var. corymbosa]|uniref:OLC1v1028631C2 n=1 Tax=Oldenlandia corymbosa var. corymbosa TaxID=529605 RepID=A0AAV1CF07_OLDCO|nr:OLC1v1028631C2 [Oldenlandia corymbosa var. corymbosa]